MSTYTTEVQICNSALIKLGLDPIASLSDDSKRARICNKQYEILRDEVLYDHPWNFAVTRVELAVTANDPLYEWDYEYALPSDCLRVLGVDENEEGDVEYSIEYNPTDGTRVLFSNKSTMNIKYIRRCEDVTQYTPKFGEVLSMRLAMDLAIPLTNSTTQAKYWSDQYTAWLRSARSFDAQEGSAPRVTSRTWRNARY